MITLNVQLDEHARCIDDDAVAIAREGGEVGDEYNYKLMN
jgi:hypothetical protein